MGREESPPAAAVGVPPGGVRVGLCVSGGWEGVSGGGEGGVLVRLEFSDPERALRSVGSPGSNPGGRVV